ncbi:MAG: acyl-CoA dehydrogenase [Actinomycetota bacterium]|nr:acyl-CoA dehydrogenase [Actinomycetota bacterium]
MDFTLDQDQQAIVDAVTTIFTKQAGADRARAVGASGHDDALLDALAQAGFLDLAGDSTIGPLGAVLVAELASRHHARANIAVRALVGPTLLGDDAPQRLAVTDASRPGPVRFGQHADVVLVLDGDEAHVATVAKATPIETPYGCPFAHLDTTRVRSLGPGSGPELAKWWQVALAAEISGALDGAVAHTVEYLRERQQFKKPLGSLQALQHRLAEAFVWAEGARWLARRAAFEATPQAAAAAAAYAAQAAQLVGTDMHQLSGAIGFTTEFDLQLWTSRLHALRVEFGGVTAHQLATTRAHWG